LDALPMTKKRIAWRFVLWAILILSMVLIKSIGSQLL
jgi:hypothetical protein